MTAGFNRYCMLQKLCPILTVFSLCTNGQDFMDIQYIGLRTLLLLFALCLQSLFSVYRHLTNTGFSTLLSTPLLPMVFIIDGCSIHHAHTWSKSGFSVWSRHFVTSKESLNLIFFPKKTLFTSCVRKVK